MDKEQEFKIAKKLSTDILKIFVLGLIAVAITIVSPFNTNKQISGNIDLFDFGIFLMAFGFIHWRYSSTVSFLYGSTKNVLPFAMSILPETSRKIGIITLSIGFIVLIVSLVNIFG